MYRLKYSWKDLVVEALRLLGGEAHLKEINKKVGFLFLMYNQVRLLPTYKKENIRDAIIRRELQQGSEDSGSYLGHENLFYHKGGDTKDHKQRTGVWGLRFKNTFWFVSQSKTFKEERSGCYLWAPYKSKIGSKQHHYDTLGSVKKGDIIFWKGHVAICLNSKKLIHAYGPEKKVVIMPIIETINRIQKTAKLKVKKISRIKY